jgi:hypothetical protein
MTSRIEQLEKEKQEVLAMRSKVESFDVKNAELLQRAGEFVFFPRKYGVFVRHLTISFVKKIQEPERLILRKGAGKN